MKNFQNKAKIVRVILSAGLFLWTLGAICVITGIVVPVLIIPSVRAGINPDPQKTYLLCDAVFCLSLVFVVNLKLFRFFGRLKDGHLFDAQTIGYLESAGKWLIALGILQGIFSVAQGLMMHSSEITFPGEGIFSGLVIIFTAWLFREGQELQEEQDLTV